MALANSDKDEPTHNETTEIQIKPYTRRTVPPELIPVIKEAEIPNHELDIQKAMPMRERTEKLRCRSWV